MANKEFSKQYLQISDTIDIQRMKECSEKDKNIFFQIFVFFRAFELKGVFVRFENNREKDSYTLQTLAMELNFKLIAFLLVSFFTY